MHAATPRRQRLTIYFNANNQATQIDNLNFDIAGAIAGNAELTTSIALDVLIGVLILGVFIFQIREQFDSLDIRHLERLKDD